MRIVRMTAMAGAMLLSLAAGMVVAAERQNWTATVSVTPSGSHVLGNPDAPVKLTEYVSYTCPHCAHFEQEADAPMRLAYVMPGKVSIEVRHLLRDPVDLTVALLTNCGDPSGFFKLHHTFLYDQDKWITKMGDMTEAQRKRWTTGEMPARLRAIADDFDFYAIMAQNGISRAAVDRCLSDKAKAQKLVSESEKAKDFGVTGTPSFALNGVLLAATHSWDSLDVQIRARL
jgi:protein-disulfide isomerase